MKSWRKYDDMGMDIWTLSTNELHTAALAYRIEVSRRHRVAERHPELKKLPAYKELAGKNIDVAMRKQGESMQAYRGRIAQAIVQAKRYLNAQTSTWTGYQQWRNNVLNAISKATGLNRHQLGQRLKGEELDKFLRFFEDFKKDGNELFHQQSSDSAFAIAYDVYMEEDNRTPLEKLEEAGRRVNEWYEEQDRKHEEMRQFLTSNNSGYPPFELGPNY